jgi:hypothetical protein
MANATLGARRTRLGCGAGRQFERSALGANWRSAGGAGISRIFCSAGAHGDSVIIVLVREGISVDGEAGGSGETETERERS